MEREQSTMLNSGYFANKGCRRACSTNAVVGVNMELEERLLSADAEARRLLTLDAELQLRAADAATVVSKVACLPKD